MTDENVVQLPTRLERLTLTLKGFLSRDDSNRKDWIEIQEGICLTLAEARNEFQADIEFGEWFDANGFGLKHQDRAAAIAMGQDPEALRKCLEATQRRSLRLICEKEFSRFTSAGKPTPRPRKPKKPAPASQPSPQFEKAKDAYDALKARGEPTGVDNVAKEAGVSSTPARIAVAYKKGQEDAPPLAPGDMSASMAKRYEATIKKARIEIREELRQEVYKELDVFAAHIKERAERADQIIASHKGVMSKETFRRIKACLHPDHNTFTFAAEALQAFSELESVLVKPEEPPRDPSTPPLPSTVAELLARRAEVLARRRR